MQGSGSLSSKSPGHGFASRAVWFQSTPRQPLSSSRWSFLLHVWIWRACQTFEVFSSDLDFSLAYWIQSECPQRQWFLSRPTAAATGSPIFYPSFKLRSLKPNLVLFTLSSFVYASAFYFSFSFTTQEFQSPRGKDVKTGHFSVAQNLMLGHRLPGFKSSVASSLTR